MIIFLVGFISLYSDEYHKNVAKRKVALEQKTSPCTVDDEGWQPWFKQTWSGTVDLPSKDCLDYKYLTEEMSLWPNPFLVLIDYLTIALFHPFAYVIEGFAALGMILQILLLCTIVGFYGIYSLSGVLWSYRTTATAIQSIVYPIEEMDARARYRPSLYHHHHEPEYRRLSNSRLTHDDVTPLIRLIDKTV